MPLRLARYGVPLAETAPAGLAAAGIEAPLLPRPVQPAALDLPDETEGLALEAAADGHQDLAEMNQAQPRPDQAPVAVPGQRLAPQEPNQETAERFAEAYQAFLVRFRAEPTPGQWAQWLRDVYGISTGAGGPLSDDQVQPLLQVLKKRYAPQSEETALPEEPVTTEWYDYFHTAWRTYAQERGAYPDAAALALYVYERDAITGNDGQPFTGNDLARFVSSFQEREFGSTRPPAGDDPDPSERPADEPLTQDADPEEALAGAGAQPAKEGRSPRVNASIDDNSETGPEGSTGEGAVLTTVDRYYLEWRQYRTEHGEEPTAEQLSAYLATKGMRGRAGNPVSPANLRRYFLLYRVYNVWTEYRMRNEEPAVDAVAQDCATRGITAQYNKPVTTEYITSNADDFERRWQALTRFHADAQQ